MTRRKPPRWWSLVPATVVLVVVIAILTTHFAATVASHPAYLVTLLVVGCAAAGVVLTSVVSIGAPDAAVAPSRRTGPWRWVVRVIAIVGVTALVGTLLYLRPLAASAAAVSSMAGDPDVLVSDSATRIELEPSGDRKPVGLIFYPGALVDPRAYVPNLIPLARAGYLVVILKLPYNIAFFDLDGAQSVIDAEPDTPRWVIGGHSLGGVAASAFAGADRPEVRGLLLWASYPSSSIADRTSLLATSIFASNDALATPAKIEASADLLPPDTTFVEIVGGVHAFFGDYGPQSGDGEPTISRDDAQEQIRSASLELLTRVDHATG